MSPLVRFFVIRLLILPLTLFLVTGAFFAMLMVVPPELRAALFLPRRDFAYLSYSKMEDLKIATAPIVKRYHMEEPFPVQYGYWLVSLFEKDGGYSPNMKSPVLPALIGRTPITAELTLYAILLYLPLSLLSGLVAGWRRNSRSDLSFRLAAYVAASLPPFILAIVLMSFFYVGLGWFPSGQISTEYSLVIRSEDFQTITGLLTIDSLLNGRLDIALDAARHLVLPVFTLSLFHWATLGRIVRSTVIQESGKEYVQAGRARGVPERTLLWRHVLPNVIAAPLSSTALSIASIFTGVFQVETVFDLKGVGSLLVRSLAGFPDVNIAMGFVVYSVSVVLIMMFILDLLRVVLDPLSREGVR